MSRDCVGDCFAGRESHLGDRVCDNGDAFSLQLQCHLTIAAVSGLKNASCPSGEMCLSLRLAVWPQV